jgi:hypothetical protein
MQLLPLPVWVTLKLIQFELLNNGSEISLVCADRNCSENVSYVYNKIRWEGFGQYNRYGVRQQCHISMVLDNYKRGDITSQGKQFFFITTWSSGLQNYGKITLKALHLFELSKNTATSHKILF